MTCQVTTSGHPRSPPASDLPGAAGRQHLRPVLLAGRGCLRGAASGHSTGSAGTLTCPGRVRRALSSQTPPVSLPRCCWWAPTPSRCWGGLCWGEALAAGETGLCPGEGWAGGAGEGRAGGAPKQSGREGTSLLIFLLSRKDLVRVEATVIEKTESWPKVNMKFKKRKNYRKKKSKRPHPAPARAPAGPEGRGRGSLPAPPPRGGSCLWTLAQPPPPRGGVGVRQRRGRRHLWLSGTTLCCGRAGLCVCSHTCVLGCAGREGGHAGPTVVAAPGRGPGCPGGGGSAVCAWSSTRGGLTGAPVPERGNPGFVPRVLSWRRRHVEPS